MNAHLLQPFSPPFLPHSNRAHKTLERTLHGPGSAANQQDDALPGLLGETEVMRALARRVRKIAQTSLPVLVRGETGTGKELVARAIHELGQRRKRPLVVVNAATVLGDMGMSQLFGHTAGAFTGATSARRGAFREAHEGTLFLDEIGSLASESQAKLLRVLEDGLVWPMGSDHAVVVDVRIVAATCEPLENRVESGTFRRDLFERLSVCRVEVPALHERPEDIPLLARAMLDRSDFRGHALTPDAVALLQSCDLPGNIRTLRNLLVQAALASEDRVISAHHIREALCVRPPPRSPRPTLDVATARRLLNECAGNKSLAARRADLPRSTFRDLLRRDLEGTTPS